MGELASKHRRDLRNFLAGPSRSRRAISESCNVAATGGIAAMALANQERLKQRIEALEKRLAQAEWRGGGNRAG